MKPTRVKPLKKCPSRDQWSAQLDGPSQPDTWLAHLEECAHCQQVLDELAASTQLWQEANETLAMRPEQVAHITESIVPLSLESGQSLSRDPMCLYELSQLQQLLGSLETEVPSNNGHGSIRNLSTVEPIARLGRYELEQLIGRGGMGLVFRAWDTELHRVVAVKTLGMTLWSLPAARQRFVREGRAAAMLNHPHIVPLYDVLTAAPVPALVMQYIAGPTLDQWIDAKGPMPWSQALRIAWQLSDALCAAHQEGLVHRDIKPGNVLLEADASRALLTDFGLVRAMDDATLTQSGLLAGTPHFMSPEQARGDDVDGRSDLFSLGALLYFAMAGKPPFRGRESMAVLHSLCHSEHESLWKVNPEVPREVSKLVDSLLSKSPADRPASSLVVRDQLRKLMDAKPRLRRAQSRAPFRLRKYVVLGVLCCLAVLAWMPYLMQPDGAPPPRAYVPPVTVSDIEADGMQMSSEYEATPGQPGIQLPIHSRSWTELESMSTAVQELEAAIDHYDVRAPMRSVMDSDFDLRGQQLDRELKALADTIQK